MIAFSPTDVVDALVEVLNGELWRLGIGSNLETVATQVQQDEIGEGIQSRIFEVPVGQNVVVAIEAYPELIDDRWGEGVVLAQGEEMEAEGFDSVKRLQIRSLVDLIQLVVDVTAAQLIAR